MRRLGVVLLIAAAAVLFLMRAAPVQNSATKSTPQKSEPTTVTPSDKKDSPPEKKDVAAKKPLPFTREGVAAKIIEEVERVSRPKDAAVALFSAESARMACVVVDGPERFVVMDPVLSAQYRATLEAQGFREPPHPMSMTMSRYASVAKTAMHFDEAKADRILVLVCPKAEWERISLEQ